MATNVEEFEGEIAQNPLFAGEDNSKSLSVWREWIQKKKTQLKPWRDFLNVNAFSKPNNIAEAGSRIVKNIEIYQTNYVVICLFLVLYCIITSPLLLLAISVSLGACYFITTRRSTKLKIFGKELSTAEQYASVLLISLPIFFLASAGSTVFWIIGVSVFIVTLHASLTKTDNQDEEITLEEIKALP